MAAKGAADLLAQHAAIVESSEDGIIGLALDGTITSWNPGAVRLYGYAAEEAVGRSIAMLVPADRPGEVARLLGEVRAGRRPGAYETLRLAKDGRTIAVSVTLSPILGSDGQVTGAAIIARDISSRTEAEAALRASEARLRAVVEGALDCIISMDHVGRVTEWNPAAEQTFGYTREAAVGQRLAELIIPPTLREAHRQALRRYLSTGQARVIGRRLELRGLRADGTEFPIELTITTQATAGEGPVQPVFTGFVRDLTERHQAEQERERLLATERAAREEAEAAVRTRDELLALASHDLQSPLTTVKVQSQLLRRRVARGDPSVSERIVAGLEMIESTASRMSAVITELVDVTRLELGQGLDLTRQPTDLVALVHRVVAELPESTQRERFCVEASEPEVVGLWDALRLERVVANLLSNAAKYSPEDAQVRVEIGCAGPCNGGEAVVVVRDRGVGIPAVDLPHIFERFHRGRNVIGQVRGTGLGLWGVRRIVEEHGGTISVESDESRGSTFTLRLPLNGPESGRAERADRDR